MAQTRVIFESYYTCFSGVFSKKNETQKEKKEREKGCCGKEEQTETKEKK